MYFAWRFSRKFFWVLSVIGSSLILSTVILRYHYVVDVFAGILLTIIIILLSEPLYKRLKAIQKN